MTRASLLARVERLEADAGLRGIAGHINWIAAAPHLDIADVLERLQITIEEGTTAFLLGYESAIEPRIVCVTPHYRGPVEPSEPVRDRQEFSDRCRALIADLGFNRAARSDEFPTALARIDHDTDEWVWGSLLPPLFVKK
ncbi:hypothetical protein QFZ27_004475 [Inquilinus ginsengisoli]|uniref:hypothetical protein n=1 Tax=Inquilinus ginsengisoli TaxID=363840 RepID=UPI003D257104